MKMTEQQINTFCKVFNIFRLYHDVILTERTFSVDDCEAVTLDEFLSINFNAEKDFIENHTFENFLNSSIIQDIMKLDVNQESDYQMSHATVKRIS